MEPPPPELFDPATKLEGPLPSTPGLFESTELSLGGPLGLFELTELGGSRPRPLGLYEATDLSLRGVEFESTELFPAICAFTEFDPPEEERVLVVSSSISSWMKRLMSMSNLVCLLLVDKPDRNQFPGPAACGFELQGFIHAHKSLRISKITLTTYSSCKTPTMDIA
jgi:hypothetical protein